MQVRSQQGDTLDALIHRYRGAQPGLLEQTLERNPHLAAHGAILPGGTLVNLPPPGPARSTAPDSIRLWD